MVLPQKKPIQGLLTRAQGTYPVLLSQVPWLGPPHLGDPGQSVTEQSKPT